MPLESTIPAHPMHAASSPAHAATTRAAQPRARFRRAVAAAAGWFAAHGRELDAVHPPAHGGRNPVHSTHGLVLRALRGDPTVLSRHGADPAVNELRVAAAAFAASQSPVLHQHEVIGAAHEIMLALKEERGGSSRKARGVYLTPRGIVEQLLDRALAPLMESALENGCVQDIRLCDPACGTGNFLVAAAERMARGDGAEPKAGALRAIVMSCIFGVDIDPLAVEACRANLAELCGGDREAIAALERNIRCADALTADWKTIFPDIFGERGGFDALIGNPPFLNQLERGTARDRAQAARLREDFGAAALAYTDAAGLFLLLSLRMTRPGGMVSLVLPRALLGSRDGSGVRAAAAKAAALEELWLAPDRSFDAIVDVCAPVFRVGAPMPAHVRVAAGCEGRCTLVQGDVLAEAGTWSPLLAAARGVPAISPRSVGRLGDIAMATADFRDQYYGLRGCIVEEAASEHANAAEFPALVTSGSIDAAHLRWGLGTTRIHGRVWTRPRVDLACLRHQTDLGPWAARRLVPKVLLATQTPVLEAVVDEGGAWLPAVPVITIVPHEVDRLWHIAAALLSPVASAWAATRYAGAGLSQGAIKLSARQALDIPLPQDEHDWDQAAAFVRVAQGEIEAARRRSALLAAAEASCRSYGLGAAEAREVIGWWQGAIGPAR